MRKRLKKYIAGAMAFAMFATMPILRADTEADYSGYVSDSELGDVNFSGDVDLTDALIALRWSLGIDADNLTQEQMDRADINRDSELGLNDVLYILQDALGIIDISSGKLEPDKPTPKPSTPTPTATPVPTPEPTPHPLSVPIENPTGKKGVIAMHWTDSGQPYYADPNELGIDHALFNMYLDEIINTDGTGEPFVYKGKTYYFNDTGSIYYTMLRMREIRQKNIAITVQMTMKWPTKSDGSVDQQKLAYIFPSGRTAGHGCYALNTSTAEMRDAISAAFHYLVTKCPYVNNWIVGTEINSATTSNYCGTLDIDTNAIIAAQTYDLMEQAIKDVSPKAKNYVCIDNIWKCGTNAQSISAKDFIAAFAKYEGNKSWNVAFHPFPVPYGAGDTPSEWNLWSPKSAQYIDHTEDSKFVTGANLDVLINFIKKYGTNHDIIMTEFGYDSRAGQTSQAAAYYYTYKAIENEPMVKCLIYQPWIDTGWDYRDMGIVEKNGAKREIYNVFKYIDVDSSKANESKYLNYLNIKSWKDNIIYIDRSGGDIKITGVYIPPNDGVIMKAGAVITGYRDNVTFECTVIDYDYQKYGTKQFPAVMRTKSKNNNWMEYKPTHPGTYGFNWRVYDANGKIISEAGASQKFN